LQSRGSHKKGLKGRDARAAVGQKKSSGQFRCIKNKKSLPIMLVFVLEMMFSQKFIENHSKFFG